MYSLPWSQKTEPEALAQIFGPALQHCVDQHPILGIVIDEPDSEQPKFRRLAELQLDQHLHFIQPDDLPELSAGDASQPQEHSLIERVLQYAVNTRFPDVREVPPWRLFVVPLLPRDGTADDHSRVLLAYHYSHSHGDGLSGLAFHHTLSQALCSRGSAQETPPSPTLVTSSKSLPPPPEPLPISWSFLLRTLAKELLPKFLTRLLMNQPQYGHAWTGRPVFFDADKFQAGVKLITIDRDSLQLALKSCKEHGIKLTGLLHLFIVRSLSAALRDHGANAASFVSSTPIDLRGVFSLTPVDMGVNASAVNYTYASTQSSGPLSDSELRAARELATELAQSSRTAQDQMVGLLKYAQPLRKWHQGKLGKARDTSYELSNVMAFDPKCNTVDEKESTAADSGVKIESVCFSQPADAAGVPLFYNVVSLRGGDLSMAISWQIGALGIQGSDADTETIERGFVDSLGGLIQEQFAKLAQRENV